MTVNGTATSVTDLTMHRRAIELTLSDAVEAGDQVTVSYSRPRRGSSSHKPTYGLGARYDKNLGAHDQRVAPYSDVVATNNTP